MRGTRDIRAARRPDLAFFLTDVTDKLESKGYEVVSGNPDKQQVRKKQSPVGFAAQINAPLEGRTSDLVIVNVQFSYAAPDSDTARNAFPEDDVIRRQFSDLAYHSRTVRRPTDYESGTMRSGADIGMRPSNISGKEMRNITAEYIRYVCDLVTKALKGK